MAIPFIGIAFGFFISCSTLSSNQRPESGDTLTAEDLKNQLGDIEQRISGNPENPEAYYQKGSVLGKLAQRQEVPGDRTSYYRQMQAALSEATQRYERGGKVQRTETIDELLQVNWSYEHNQGVEILQNDSTTNAEDFSRAAAHFNNAIIIIPDSAVSYKMKARALYQNGDTEMAIKTLEAARSQIEDLPGSYIEQLAYLYLEQDRPQEAITIYEETQPFSEENLNLLHGLANAYITADWHRRAIQLLGRLVKNEPGNPVYLESYGTELYRLGVRHYDSLSSESSMDSLEMAKTRAGADTLFAMAKNQFRTLVEGNPQQLEYKQQLADMHKNHAVKLNQVKSLFPEPVQREMQNQLETSLTDAATLYEDLTEQRPDRTVYWENLYQVYSSLGMQERANEVKAKANL